MGVLGRMNVPDFNPDLHPRDSRGLFVNVAAELDAMGATWREEDQTWVVPFEAADRLGEVLDRANFNVEYLDPSPEQLDALKAMPVEEALPIIERAGLNDWPKKGPIATKLFPDGVDNTQDKFSTVVDGKRRYVPEREELHRRLVGNTVANGVAELLGEDDPIVVKLRAGESLSPDERSQVRQAANDDRGGAAPQALFMAGGAASGKSSALTSDPAEAEADGKVLRPRGAVTANPDDFKEMLPEYKEMTGGDTVDKYAANGVHEESSDLAKETERQARELGLNLVVDGTGNGKPKQDGQPSKFEQKFEDLHASGYDIEAVYVSLPTDIAFVRAMLRAWESGRWVPGPEIRNQHARVSTNFHDIAALDYVKSLKVFDNQTPKGVPPTLVAQSDHGKEMNVIEPDLFQMFLDKENG